MNISPKIIILFSSLITITCGVFLFHFLKKKEVFQEFIYSNWLYRKSITINNNSSKELLNEDILVIINTEELISSQKLLNNCFDLRFIDEDNISSLKYWIEGGCNNETTQVWVRIPSLPPEGKTIYIYYGNESATDSQESWEGNFLIQGETPCEQNWEKDNLFNGKIPRASTKFGLEGGKKEHIHVLSLEDSQNCINKALLFKEGQDTCDNSPMSLQTSSSQYFFEKLPVYFCKGKEGFLPSNSIVMFDQKSPSDWEHFKKLDNKFTVGIDEELIDTGDTLEHSHSVLCNKTSNITNGNLPFLIIKNSNSAEAPNSLPYFNFNYIFNNHDSFAPSKAIMMFDEIPPLGWLYYSAIENLFPRGSSSQFKEQGGDILHTHTFNLSFTIQMGDFNSKLHQYICIDNSIEKNMSIYTKAEELLPPYITVIFAQKKESQEVILSEEFKIVNEKENFSQSKPDSKENLSALDIENFNNKDYGDVLGEASPGKPTDLLTDGLTDPVYIQSSTPSFSAIHTDPDEDSASAYQIQVNSAVGFDGTSLWDSGKEATTVNHNSRSPEYTYAGTALTNSLNTLYWRIRFWDTDDNVSEWSDTAEFVDLYNKVKIEGISFEGIKLD